MNSQEAINILCEYGVYESTAKKTIDYVESWEDCPLLFSACNLGGVADKYGHASDRHLNISDEMLHQRANRMTYGYETLNGASRFNFTSETGLMKTFKYVLYCRANLQKMAEFLLYDEDETAIGRVCPSVIGEGAYAGADRNKLYPVSGVIAVVKRHSYQPFRMHTMYPAPKKSEREVIREDIDKYHPWVRERERQAAKEHRRY